MNDKPKDVVIHNSAPDGEFICVYGTEERRPAPELLPPEGGLSQLMEAAEGRAPKTVITKKPSLFDAAVTGFVYALYVGWQLIRVIAAGIAILVAAAVVGYCVYLTTRG